MLVFISFRLFELVTLIPTLGMLAWFVGLYVNANQLTPNYILALFIVSVLAAAWALATLFRRDSTRRSAAFVAFIDLCFVGALIGGIYELRDIANYDCINVSGGPSVSGDYDQNGNVITISPVHITFNAYTTDVNKTCSMLKASWAFAIMNCMFFFVTFLVCLMLHRSERGVVVEKTTYRRRSHDSRRGHSAHGSHRRSSHDSRRQYYV